MLPFESFRVDASRPSSSVVASGAVPSSARVGAAAKPAPAKASTGEGWLDDLLAESEDALKDRMASVPASTARAASAAPPSAAGGDKSRYAKYRCDETAC